MAIDYSPPAPGSKIIIVGGGCFGLSTAYALALKNQYEVYVFERQAIPCPDAASCDINKIVRMDYANDTLYMHLMVEGFNMWHQWNKERAEKGLEPVFNQSGVILFSQNGEFSDFEKDTMKTIREAGYGHFIEEFKSEEEIVKKFPQFKSAVKNGFNKAYLNNAGGWCNSSAAVEHLYEKCLEQGVKFVVGSDSGCLDQLYCDPKNPDTVVGIKTTDGKVHYGDRVILATGSWTAGKVNMHNQVVATGQKVIHFTPPEHIRKEWAKLPVFCADLSITGFYGFPCNAGGKFKVGKHDSGYLNPRTQDEVSVPRTQMTHVGDTLPIGAVKEFRGFLDKFFPETTKLDITYGRVCWYSDSIDGDFVITPHPDYKNLVVAAGDSGHGMKFLPNIGFKIRDVIEGIDTEYTRAWRWRDMDSKDTKLDGLRADSLLQREILCEANNENCRMAESHEFKAAPQAKL